MTPRIVVLDYGSGNLRSAERALTRAGGDVVVTDDLTAAATADGLVVPGVGAYASCMAALTSINADRMIADRIALGRRVLGICVGMQVMFEYGEEHGRRTTGLGLLPGGVTRLSAPRVPHMGWNTVSPALTAEPQTRFYFVHSYAAQDIAALTAVGVAVTTATYGVPFVAAVESGALMATQFHPEKSGDAGAALLHRWVDGCVPAGVGA